MADPSPSDDVPRQLPAGVELPDGTVVAFQPHRDCDCSTCRAAFEALREGTLTFPEGGLPW